MEDLAERISAFLSVGGSNGYGYGYGDGYCYGNGYGYCYGNGDGNGYGNGDGNGNGNGDGNGYGNGDGNGNGNGDGNGYGNGDGYCYGSGDGYCYGNGYGNGYGIKSLKGYTVYRVDGTPTLIYAVKGNLAVGATISSDFTLSECYIAKHNGFFAHGSTARDAVNAATMKALENEPTEDRIKRFAAAYPNPDDKIPAQELFEWHHILTGSCEFGRRQFAQNHDIDLSADSFTVKEFVRLTENEYGGDNIRLLAAEYGMTNR